jgi:23S rRNA pseudouridine1911/1915/1917 synthase
MELPVIHEDNHLLVVFKPAGVLVQGDRSGETSLLDLARQYLKRKYDKPGNVYLGLVHRLDRNVSGVVVLARTSKAAGRLSAQFRDKTVTKTYLAVTEGAPAPPAGRLTAWLGARADARGRTPAGPFPEAKEAELGYRTLDRRGGRALVEVVPVTGRRHQIRVQMALAGCPLLGDVKYGASGRLPEHRVALHAWKLALKHPVGGAALEFVADPPPDWPWPMKDIGHA